MTERRWCFLDLVTDPRTGRLRESALWSNVAKAAMTWGFIYVIVKGGNSEFLWIAYGGALLAHESIARVMNQRQQKLDNEEAKP